MWFSFASSFLPRQPGPYEATRPQPPIRELLGDGQAKGRRLPLAESGLGSLTGPDAAVGSPKEGRGGVESTQRKETTAGRPGQGSRCGGRRSSSGGSPSPRSSGDRAGSQ